MNHRHLLPDEIDLLVDGEEGFGVAPLAAHVAACPDCSAEVEAQRQLVGALERLPQLAPSPLFSHRVMAQVQVFEPWHVAALDSLRRLLPQSRPGRILAGATAGLVAFTLTLATVLIVTRIDAVAFLATVATEHLRSSLVSAAGSVMATLFGEGAVEALRTGGTSGTAVVLTAFLLTVLVSAFALRAVASASRRRRL